MSSFRITKELEKIPKRINNTFIDENNIFGDDFGIGLTLSKIDDTVTCSWTEISNSLKVENTGTIFIQIPVEYTPLDMEPIRFIVPGNYRGNNLIYVEVCTGYITFMPSTGMVFVQGDEVLICKSSITYHV